jgi:hypothetical protein
MNAVILSVMHRWQNPSACARADVRGAGIGCSQNLRFLCSCRTCELIYFPLVPYLAKRAVVLGRLCFRPFKACASNKTWNMCKVCVCS